jgi:hypothetical protein
VSLCERRTNLADADAYRLWLSYEYESIEASRLETQVYSCRYDSLRFLAWLIGRDLLWRGLSAKRTHLAGPPWISSHQWFTQSYLPAALRKIEARGAQSIRLPNIRFAKDMETILHHEDRAFAFAG